jgi:PAS domain S-box-containing protein
MNRRMTLGLRSWAKLLPLLAGLTTAALLMLAAQAAILVLTHRAADFLARDKAAHFDVHAEIFANRISGRISDLFVLQSLAGSEMGSTGGMDPGGPTATAIRSMLSAHHHYGAAAIFDKDGNILMRFEPMPGSAGPLETPWDTDTQNFQSVLDAGPGVLRVSSVAFKGAAAHNPLLVFSCPLFGSDGDAAGILCIVFRAGTLLGEIFPRAEAGSAHVLMDADGRWGLEVGGDGTTAVLDAWRTEDLASVAAATAAGKKGRHEKGGVGVVTRRVSLTGDAPERAVMPMRVEPPGALDWVLVAEISGESLAKYVSGAGTGIRLVTLAAMLLLVPCSYFATLYYLASARNRRQLDRVLESSMHGIVALEPSGKVPDELVATRINKAAAGMLGPKRTPAPASEILPFEILRRIQAVIVSGQPAEWEHCLPGGNGNLWLYLRAAPMAGGAVLSLADISGRKADEEALRASESSLKLTAQIGRIGAWRIDYPGRKLWRSPEVRRMHGMGEEDEEPDVATALNDYTPTARERLEGLLHACETEGRPFDTECEFRDAKGNLKWVRVIGEMERDPATGNPIRLVGAMQDMTEAHATKMALDESAKRLELAFWGGEMSSFDWRIDRGGVSFDGNWLATLGYNHHEIQQTLEFWDSLIPAGDLDLLHKARARCLERHSNHLEAEYRMRAKDGSHRWVLERSRIVGFGPNGAPARIAGVVIDITKLKDVENQLAEALDRHQDLVREAREAAESKRDFLAVMSHEIRTPMNSILGFAELLEDTPRLEEHERDHLKTIRQSGEALLRIINDILEYTRLEAGRLPLTREAFSPGEVVAATAGLLAPAAMAKGLVLHTQIEPSVPQTVLGDPGRLQQVLVNLVGNAVKCTASGKVTIGVDAAAAHDGNQEIAFAVHDTGMGIPADKLSHIFEPFAQVRSAGPEAHGGSGLGLSISRLLVDLMGGTLEVESSVGKGSTFFFTLTFAIPTTPAADLQSPPATPPGPAHATPPLAEQCPLKILVAEDDRVNARLTKLVLEKLGYKPTLVADGMAAVEEASLIHPGFILMDIHMPRLDGVEATRRIRMDEEETPARPRAFIAAFTADILPSASKKCFAAGMDDFITKPLSIKTLSSLLMRAAGTPTPGHDPGPGTESGS